MNQDDFDYVASKIITGTKNSSSDDQGSMHHLVRAPVGARLCDIFRFSWCWCGASFSKFLRCGPSFLVYFYLLFNFKNLNPKNGY